ncbi:FHA domain-containing protein, partial [Candidatus Gracilibacteria bacterium]|nr:FHA domain-containing protein [Candidatus Gracilibacteria bacterium]
MNFPKQKFAEKRLVFFADGLSSAFSKHEQKIQKAPKAKVEADKNIVDESQVTKRVTKINERIGKSKLSKKFQDKIRKNLGKFFTKKQKTLKSAFRKIDEKSAAKLVKIHTQTLKELDQFEKEKEVAELYEMIEPIFKKEKAIKKIIDLVTYRRKSGHWEKINADLAKIGVTKAQIETLQKHLKIRQDGEMGPQTINAVSKMLKSGISVKFARETLYKGQKQSVEAKALEKAAEGKKPAGTATITTPQEIVKIEDISSSFQKAAEILNGIGVVIKAGARIKNFKGKKSDLTAMLKSVRALAKANPDPLDVNKVRMAITEFANGNASGGKELIDALIGSNTPEETIEAPEELKQTFTEIKGILGKMGITFDQAKYIQSFQEKGKPASLPGLLTALHTVHVVYERNPKSFTKDHKETIKRGLRQYCLGYPSNGEETIFKVIEHAELQNKERAEAELVVEESREQIKYANEKLKTNAQKIDGLIKDFDHVRKSTKFQVKKHQYLIQLRQAQLARVDMISGVFKVRDKVLDTTKNLDLKERLELIAKAGMPETFKIQNFKIGKRVKSETEKAVEGWWGFDKDKAPEIVVQDDSISFGIKDNVAWPKVHAHINKQLRHAQRDAYMQSKDGHHFNEYKSVADELSKEEKEDSTKEMDAFQSATMEKVTLPEDQKELLKGILKERLDKVITGFSELQQSTNGAHPAQTYSRARAFYETLRTDNTANMLPQLMGLPISPELTAALLPAQDLYKNTLEIYKPRTIKLCKTAMTNSAQINRDKRIAISYINDTKEFIKQTKRTLQSIQKDGEGIHVKLLAQMRRQAVQMFHDPRRNKMRQLGAANFMNNFHIRENDEATPFDFAMQATWGGMNALYKNAPEYADAAGSIFNAIIRMKGDPVTFIGYLETMEKPVLIAGVAILGAVTFGAALGVAIKASIATNAYVATGFFSKLAVTSFVTGTGAFIGQQAGLSMTGNANAIDSWEKNVKMWGTSVGMQFAAGAAGTAFGIGLGKATAALTQNSKFWGERFTSYVRVYSERLIRGAQRGQPPTNLLARTKNFFKEFSEEAFDEIMEEGMETLGRAIVMDHPIVGFIFMAFPSGTKRARSNFIATNGSYVAAPGITARVSETGVVFQHDGDVDALKDFLESKGAPAGLVANIDSEGNGMIEVNGLKIEVQKSAQPAALREFLSTPKGHKAAKAMGLRFNPATGNYEHGNNGNGARAELTAFFESEGYGVIRVEADGTLVLDTGNGEIRVTPTSDVTRDMDAEIDFNRLGLDSQPESIRQLFGDHEGLAIARQAGLEFNRETNSFTYTNQAGYNRLTTVLGAMGYSVTGVSNGILTWSNGTDSIRITLNPDATPDTNSDNTPGPDTPGPDGISGIVTEHAEAGGNLNDQVKMLPKWMQKKTLSLIALMNNIPALVKDTKGLKTAQDLWAQIGDQLKTQSEPLHKALSEKWNGLKAYISLNLGMDEIMLMDMANSIARNTVAVEAKSLIAALIMEGYLIANNPAILKPLLARWEAVRSAIQKAAPDLYRIMAERISAIMRFAGYKAETAEAETPLPVENEESIDQELAPITDTIIASKAKSIMIAIYMNGALLIDDIPKFADIQKQWNSISAKVKASSKELFNKIQAGINNVAARIEAKMENFESQVDESVQKILDLIPKPEIRKKVAAIFKIISDGGGRLKISSTKAMLELYTSVKGKIGPASAAVLTRIKHAVDSTLAIPSFFGGAIFQAIWSNSSELITEDQKEEFAEIIAETEMGESYKDGKLDRKLTAKKSFRFKVNKTGKSVFLNDHEVPLTIDKDGNLVVHVMTATGSMPFTLKPGQSQILGRKQERSPIEDDAVSRVHAHIKYLGDGRIVMTDQGSANGTKVANSKTKIKVEAEIAPVITDFRVGDQVNAMRTNLELDPDWTISEIGKNGVVVIWSERIGSAKTTTVDQLKSWNPQGPIRMDSNTAEKIARLDIVVRETDALIADIMLNDYQVPRRFTASLVGELNDIEISGDFGTNKALQLKYKIITAQLETIQNFEIEQQRVAQMIGELYNGNIEEDFEQGQIGNCYMLAALKALKNDPQLMKTMLAKTIRKVGRGRWEVRFLGAESSTPIIVTEANLRQWRRHKSGKMKGAKGDQILEVAYAQLKASRAGRGAMDIDARGDYAVEGGHAHRALHDLLGPFAQKRKLYQFGGLANGPAVERQAIDFIRNAFISKNGEYVVTATTTWVAAGDSATFSIEGKTFHHSHAYAVVGYDAKTDSVLLSNPHDSAKNIKISLHGFLRGFAQVNYIRKKPIDIALSKLDAVREIGYIKEYLDGLLGKQNEKVGDLLNFSSNLSNDQRIINIINNQENPLVKLELERRFAALLRKNKNRRERVPEGDTMMGEMPNEFDFAPSPLASTPGERQNSPDATVDPLNPKYDYSD